MSLSTEPPETGSSPAPANGGSGPGSGDEKPGFSLGSWEIVAGVVLLVSALVIIIVLTSGGDGDGDGDGGSDTPPATFAAPTADGGSDAGGEQTGPTVPEGMSPTIVDTEQLATDNFDRPDDPASMGEAAPGQDWVPVAGEWGIIDDQAYVSGPGDPFAANLVVLTGVEMFQGTVQADISSLTNGSGLLFRYLGPFNYFTIMPTPDSVSWRIQKVVNGERDLVGVLPFAPVKDGTTVTVQLQARRIEVYFDGQPWGSFTDEDLVFANAVGLAVAGSESGDARIDNFEVGQIGDGSMPGLEDVEPEGGGG